MERITVKNLKAVMGIMAREMGIPDGPVWTRDDKGHNKARIGALVLQQGSRTYGNAWIIAQIVNDGGGENTLLRGSTARELWDAAHAWREGFRAAERVRS